MIVITDVSVPADAFPLGRVLDEYPDIEIELERLVPLSDALIPLFWVDDGTADRIEATLEADDLTKSVQRLTQTGSRVLYEIEWEPDITASSRRCRKLTPGFWKPRAPPTYGTSVSSSRLTMH